MTIYTRRTRFRELTQPLWNPPAWQSLSQFQARHFFFFAGNLLHTTAPQYCLVVSDQESESAQPTEVGLLLPKCQAHSQLHHRVAGQCEPWPRLQSAAIGGPALLSIRFRLVLERPAILPR